MQGSLAVSLPSPPPVTHTPSVSVGLYPQPPAACLEQQQQQQQQRETVGSQRNWRGGRAGGETVGERKEEGEMSWIFDGISGQLKLQQTK